MTFYRYALLSCAVAAILTGKAYADDFKVYSPRVEKGEFAAEANLNYSFDHREEQDGYFSQVVGGEYGVNDWWQTELAGEFEKENGDNNKLNNIKWENIIAPWKPGENFVDAGFYAELEKSTHSEDPNNFEAKLLLEKNIDRFVNTANLKLEHEFGNNAEDKWGSGLAWRTKYRYAESFEPGFEYHADFGRFDDGQSFNDQEHLLGPVAEGKFGKVKYDAGVLFGVSDSAPDTTVKLNLEYEF